MTILAPMRSEAYPAFLEEAIAFYAAQSIAGGRWRADEALGLAEAETMRMLPCGLETRNHYIFEIFAVAGQEPVGYVWFTAVPRGTVKVAFIVQLKVASGFQSRGHGRKALKFVEQRAQHLGFSGTELMVFAHNPRAQALYESVGYKVSSFNMSKPFSELAPNPSFKRTRLRRSA